MWREGHREQSRQGRNARSQDHWEADAQGQVRQRAGAGGRSRARRSFRRLGPVLGVEESILIITLSFGESFFETIAWPVDK
jgi:hypothetical protein